MLIPNGDFFVLFHKWVAFKTIFQFHKQLKVKIGRRNIPKSNMFKKTKLSLANLS